MTLIQPVIVRKLPVLAFTESLQILARRALQPGLRRDHVCMRFDWQRRRAHSCAMVCESGEVEKDQTGTDEQQYENPDTNQHGSFGVEIRRFKVDVGMYRFVFQMLRSLNEC